MELFAIRKKEDFMKQKKKFEEKYCDQAKYFT